MRPLRAVATALVVVGLAYYAVPLLFLVLRLAFSRCGPCL